MADVEPELEVLETRLMRGWMNRDARDLKALIAADGIIMFGATPPVILDRPSFTAAIESRLVLERFRFGAIAARRHGRAAWFSAHVELEMRLDRREWHGGFLLNDLWIKGRVRRRWKLVERGLAPVDKDERRSAAIRALQLWR